MQCVCSPKSRTLESARSVSRPCSNSGGALGSILCIPAYIFRYRIHLYAQIYRARGDYGLMIVLVCSWVVSDDGGVLVLNAWN